ncbi:Cytochrome P450 82C4 [Morus notabilis]|uniref:Cytochrome P450 82C4 n=1 Tax=Morus notabilis TaxID=981085 RepID=W9RT06_9ROSA|nr:Cytochrome P450 82C4 [Morus notabilis]
MEFSITHEYYSISPFTISIIFLLIIFFLSLRWVSKNYAQSNTTKIIKLPPEPSGAWPLIGHLLLLRKPKPLHITLGNIADEYGPLFTIKLGVHRVLVVSRWDMAKECLATNDRVFANRPKSSLALEILGYDFTMMGFSFYGPYWRQVRKIAITELLSTNRVEMLKHAREYEVSSAIKEIHDLWINNNKTEVLVDMKRWFSDINTNVILRMLVGKPFVVRGPDSSLPAVKADENERCRKAMRDFFNLAGDFPIGEALPLLRFLDLDGKEKAMKRTAKVLDDFAQDWLDEHKEKRRSGDYHDQVEKDFMTTMLSVLDHHEEIRSPYGSDKIIKATCLANESDIKNLPYLHSIIKETLRLYPAGPLLIPYESMEDCTVGGYHIPAGTRVLINVSKIQRDPHVWPDPDKFLPERFLTSAKNCDVRGQNFELIPFGSGRRICPGVTLGLQVMLLTLANLLQGFDIATPLDEPLDVSETSGMTNLKAGQLDVLLIPRLSHEIYG